MKLTFPLCQSIKRHFCRATYDTQCFWELSSSQVLSGPSVSWHYNPQGIELILTNFDFFSDSTIVTTLTDAITVDMESPSIISWLGASYLIATALVQPLCGQLSDIHTRRNCFFVGSLAFLLGNIACATAQSLGILVAGRSLSGVGGGVLTIMPTIILTDITPREERGLWQGINNIVFGLGHGMGGAFGGIMAHYWSWRMSFLSLVLPTFLLIIGTVLIPEPAKNSLGELPFSNNEGLPLIRRREEDQKDVDIAGAVLLCVGLGLLLISTHQLNLDDSVLELMTSTFWFVVSSMCLVTFVFHALFMAKEPILPLRLLSQFSSTGSLCLVTFLSQYGFTFAEFYLPLLFSLQEHTKMELVGWCLVPLSGSAAMGSLFAGGLLSRFRLKSVHVLLGSSAILCIGTMGIPYMAHRGLIRTVQVVFVSIWGFGFGGLATVSLIGLLEDVQLSTQASATSLLYASRSLGGAFSLPAANIAFDIIRRYRFQTLLIQLAKSENRYDLLKHIKRLVQALVGGNKTIREIPNSWRPYLYTCELESTTLLFMIPVVSSLAILFLVIVATHKRG